MEVTCKPLSLEKFKKCYESADSGLDWSCPFILPFWLSTWTSVADNSVSPLILGVYQAKRLVGIAPLQIKDGHALFLGSESIFDFQEIIYGDGAIKEILKNILLYLQNHGVRELSLGAVGSDSPISKVLPGLCRDMGLSSAQQAAGQMAVLDLPTTWEGYLALLSKKQRHEVRRKMRRLREKYHYQYDVIENPENITAEIDVFFQLFRKSRKDKSVFLDDFMSEYFRRLAAVLADQGLLHLGKLSLNGKVAAYVFGFQYRDTFYLYNNAYDPDYGALSVGALAKVFCINDCIERGVARFNFLKGDERYKVHLGGKPEPLYRFRVVL